MLRDWATVHRHGVVSTVGFTHHVARYAAEPLDDLFTAWLYEPALPPLPVPARPPIPARPGYPPTNGGSKGGRGKASA